VTDFFLGREINSEKEVFLKPDSFNTHAFVLGMTGSGKTGLLISILEELALNEIPAVIIDPKGDLTNRLLVFREVTGETLSSYLPENKIDDFISKYREGLNEWRIGQEKIEHLLQRKIKIYTPGLALSPVNVLERFSSIPSKDEANILEKANSITASLLSLTQTRGDDATTSPQGLLLSSLFIDSWKKGEDLTLEILLERIVEPPFSKLGILPLNTVISREKRISFAVELNGVLSSPLMTYFHKGDELNFDKLFFDTKNETIFTLSQLSDEQREFFLGIFLSELYRWVRRQNGSEKLKMALVFDEVFGFFPPYPKNPPTKQPLMGLLKQGRAFGFSTILSTQNPYDVDYKGLTNAGLWFIGRLQTQNDIERVKEGLSTISGGVQAVSYLPQLKQREFVLNDVRKENPIVFKTRQCVSLLLGPLSENQLKNFVEEKVQKAFKNEESEIFIAPKGIQVLYGNSEILSPNFLFEAEIPYKISGRIFSKKKKFVSEIKEGGLNITLSFIKEFNEEDVQFSVSKPPKSKLSKMPQWLYSSKKEEIEKEITEILSLKYETEIFKHPSTGIISEPEETLENFLQRVKNEKEILETKRKQKELKPLLEKKKAKELILERSRIKLDRLKTEYEKRKAETYTTAGVGILRGIFGSKRSILGGISSTMSKERMAETAKARYEEQLILYENLKKEIEEITKDIENLSTPSNLAVEASEVEKIKILPFKSGIRLLGLTIVYK